MLPLSQRRFRAVIVLSMRGRGYWAASFGRESAMQAPLNQAGLYESSASRIKTEAKPCA